MTHIELTDLFKRSGVTQKEFVQWANALGMKTRPGDVSNHKRGDTKHRIGKRYAQLYRDFFAEKTEGNFRTALAIATKNVLASGGDRVIFDVPPDAADLGEQNSKPVFRTRVEWYPGMVIEHPRAAARLYGVKDAAIVA